MHNFFFSNSWRKPVVCSAVETNRSRHALIKYSMALERSLSTGFYYSFFATLKPAFLKELRSIPFLSKNAFLRWIDRPAIPGMSPLCAAGVDPHLQVPDGC